jgi:hypothetical protein
MASPVIIMSITEIAPMGSGGAREGQATYKQFPLDTGISGTALEFSWNSYDVGYATPRHKHAFDQFRYALDGDRQIKDGYLKPGDCGFYPEGVSYGPQLQKMPSSGLGLQFQGPEGIPYETHAELQAARKRLSARGGTFADGVYTEILANGHKINKDSHAACWEEAAGQKFRYPPARFATPIVMMGDVERWVPDRRLAGVEHKHLGTFGERRSAARLLRLAPGARIPAHASEDAEIFYLIDGSIAYDGKTWLGGKTADRGTYLYTPHGGAAVKEIGTETGGTFFILTLPLVADIEMELKAARQVA